MQLVRILLGFFAVVICAGVLLNWGDHGLTYNSLVLLGALLVLASTVKESFWR